METAYIQLMKPDFPSNADFFPSADIRQSVAEHRSPIFSNRKDTFFFIIRNKKSKYFTIFAFSFFDER